MESFLEEAEILSRATSVRSLKSVSSVREMVFSRNSTTNSSTERNNNNNNNSTNNEEDEEELMWAAIERLPTYDRVRRGILLQQQQQEEVTDVNGNGKGKRVFGDREVVDVTKLGAPDKKLLIDSVLKIVENDNEKLLSRIRDRVDRVGIQIPSIEVRFENVSIEGDAYLGTRALPTLLNTTLNAMEFALSMIGLSPSKKRVVKVLQDVSGIIRPSRLALLLGPPASGKTTFLKSLAGKAAKDLRIQGRITYCGHEFREFVPQRTSAYISQHDVHFSELTVRETLDFAGRCMGVGTKYDMLVELSRREKERGIKPDPEIDAFMKATAVSGQKTCLTTDYVLKILGLDICADIIIGDGMIRGISGGQKKRVTTGEMLVGPAKAFFMDEISTGLDSATTFQIVKFMKQMVHINDITMVISLLQPPPETFELFDDVILLSDGQIVYQGPCEHVLEFFEYVGFKCPERKGIADFMQEVTSVKDQEQYWFRNDQPHRYISAEELAQAFSSFHVGQQLSLDLQIPYDKSKMHPAALVKEKYGISRKEIFRACFARQWLLMKRIWVLNIFKIFQITLMAILAMSVFFRTQMKAGGFDDAAKFFGALFFGLINVMFNGMTELVLTVLFLPTFYKQRDSLFYPGWAYALPLWFLSIPISIIESALWISITYYTIGLAPAASRFFKQLLAFIGVHQMAFSLFRCIGAVGRSVVVANTLGMFFLLGIFVLGGFIVSKDNLKAWMVWGYYASPMTYGQNAIAMNEFLDERWATPTNGFTSEATVGKTLLKSRGLFFEDYMYWMSIVALFGFILLFNLLFVAALTFLNPLGDTKSIPCDQDEKRNQRKRVTSNAQGVEMTVRNGQPDVSSSVGAKANETKRGMVLPFQPLSLAFSNVNYYVDMPAEMKAQGFEEGRLQLLRNVSGAFRPGVLTALVGISGAGKSTLMDVLAGRKTGGYVEGSISISGYPKNQDTFARVCGYCEQNDIHSPHVTVYESLLYSAWLRLPGDINAERRKMFAEEVMGLVELGPLRNSIVGLPGVDGLSTEQRKRLTIAVELVANPSIIFMDEPTSGLDARAAAIVMRTVRNIGDTGRTIVCTIHQPSIDIFESFDELLLMKRGGQVIYAGELGPQSQKLTEYFEAIPGVPYIKEGYNPATWMLDVTTVGMETQLDVDFAEIYESSELYSKNQELIKELSTPVPGSKDLYFPTKYSQSYLTQFRACLCKQYWSYWRDSKFNVSRFGMTIFIGLLFGAIFWDKGSKISKQQDLQNVLGAIYAAVFFLGATNASSIQSVVGTERTVYYREKAAGMYSAMPYAFSQVLMEAFYVCIQTLLYTLMLYTMIGFQWTPEKFFYFYFFIFASYAYCSFFGMMLVGLTPALAFAGILMSFFFNFWNLFAGFVIPRVMIPIWWRWYYWCSPVAWTIYGLLTSQLGDRTDDVEVLGRGKMPIYQFLKETYGFDHDFLFPVILTHIGWIVFFVFVYAYATKVLNFQKR